MMGTKFSLKDPNPGIWFTFDEKDPDSGRICLRVLNASIVQNINKATSKKRPEYKQGNRFEVIEVDEDLRSKLIWDYTIVDWERLEDDEGKSIECNSENKNKLMLENIGFASFIRVCLDKLNAEFGARQESLEKN